MTDVNTLFPKVHLMATIPYNDVLPRISQSKSSLSPLFEASVTYPAAAPAGREEASCLVRQAVGGTDVHAAPGTAAPGVMHSPPAGS